MKINIKKLNLNKQTKKIFLVCLSLIISIIIPIQIISNSVFADQYDDKINALKVTIAAYQAEAARLNAEAQTLQSALAIIDAQKAQIQSQINLSQVKYDQLIQQIADTEQDITNNQNALGITIANLYVESDITPIEMIFGSKNISEYMDKQEYRNSVRNALTSTITKIKELKIQLEVQRTDVKRVLDDQKSQRDILVEKQNEQQNLINETQGQEAVYQQLSAQQNIEINRLRAQQAAELAARARNIGGGYLSSPGDGNKGGYPSAWGNAPINYYVDDWGMYSRQCVSYTAFKVEQAYGNMPYWGGRGNANQWPANARAAGIKTSSTPAAGTVGVVSSGTYGHVAWVESVNSDGTINISHFNVNWSGDYFEWYNLSPSYFDTYIYFGG